MYWRGRLVSDMGLRGDHHPIGARIATHRMIQRVALDGDSAGFADETLQVSLGKFLARGAVALALDDVIPADDAIHVIDAVGERELRERDPLHDPEGFDVRD